MLDADIYYLCSDIMRGEWDVWTSVAKVGKACVSWDLVAYLYVPRQLPKNGKLRT